MYYPIYFASFAFGCFGAWLVYFFGPAFGILDAADHRSSHVGVVPKGGGIGILSAFLFTALYFNIPSPLWISASLLALFSFCGDKTDLSPKLRLPAQFLTAFLFLGFVVLYDQLPLFNHLSLYFNNLSIVFCFLFFTIYIVGTANYYNFMDGINGIAGITGAVAYSLIAVFISFSGGEENFYYFSISLVFACLGFLPFNIPKARVFMGDVGSILLGYVFAALVVLLAHNFVDFIMLCAFLFPFYADELYTSYIRLRDGENLVKPHRRHIYQLLANEMKIDHWKVSFGYGFLQLLIGLSALGLRQIGGVAVLTFLIICFASFWSFGYWVRRRAEYMGKILSDNIK